MKMRRNGWKGGARKQRVPRPPRQIPQEGHSPLRKLAHGITQPFLKGLLGVALGGCIILISVLGPRENVVKVKVGDVASETIKATTDFEMVDEENTARLRASEEARVPPVYDFDNQASARVLSQLNLLCENRLVQGRSTVLSNLPGLSEECSDIVCKLLPKLLEKTLQTPIRSSKDAVKFSLDRRLVVRGLKEGKEVILSEEDVKTEEDAISSIMAQLSKGLPSDEASITSVKVFVGSLMKPTLVYSVPLTSERQKAAAEAVPPILIRISQGETILEEGKKIDEKQMFILKELKRLEAEQEFMQGVAWLRMWDIIGRVILMSLLILLVWLIAKKDPEARDYPLGRAAVLGLAIVVAVITMRAALVWWDYETQLAVSVCAIGLLALVFSALHGWLMASSNTVALAFLAGLMMRDRVEIALVAGGVGLFGAACMRGTTRRTDLLRVGIIMVFTASLASLGAGLWDGKDVLAALREVPYGSLGAFIAMALTPVALWLFESLFSSSSDIRLLELSDLRSPLLRRLDKEAPGTYEHSLLVANLAEVGAFAVGANPLRAKVGSLYHDIGKVSKPEYFVENQPQGRSKHTKLAPSMSALILTSHVKEGIQMAQEAKLPNEIVDIIIEHHGTSKIAFFYQKALSQDGATREEDFRYGGPKPQSKESAVVMLADSVEAASRSLETRSASRIKKMVKSVVDGKFEDGQLDECPLTLKDVTSVTEVFSRVLTAFYHARIEYPDESQKPSGAATDNGHPSSEPTA